MIEALGLYKQYGPNRVLDDASLTVATGERIVLTGDNGSGKTTLLHVLAGLRRPDAGQVLWHDRPLTRAGRRAWCRARRRWGVLPQQVSLPPRATVRRLLRFHARLRGTTMDPARQWLERVGLADAERQQAGALSGGMRQRLAIALTLFHEPELILMDEPGSSLDPSWRNELTRWICEAANRGAGVLIASQLHELWATEAQHYRCEAGRVVAPGNQREARVT